MHPASTFRVVVNLLKSSLVSRSLASRSLVSRSLVGGASLTAICVTATQLSAQQLVPPKPEGTIRIATYNASLNRPAAGKLTEDLKADDPQIKAIATVVRAAQPDILLINELDYSSDSDNAALLEQNYFANSEPDLLGGPAWSLPHHYSAPSNTGTPSGMDLDNNGRTEEPNDAFGFGRFEGQYGMAVFSRFEVANDQAVTLQKFLWSQLPDAMRPMDPKTNKSFYPDSNWEKMRLSSKSFWDLPIESPQGTIHVLASHPTPPAFDGAEDRNGCRNHDEIKLIQLYIESNAALRDDRDNKVTFPKDASFVVLGDLNCDPQDGDSRNAAINALIQHPLVAQMPAPRSTGSELAAKSQGKLNARHKSAAAEDTADFNDSSVGNLRVDYVLPSKSMKVLASGVFWPSTEDLPADKAAVVNKLLDASDHHLVWIDVKLK